MKFTESISEKLLKNKGTRIKNRPVELCKKAYFS